MGPPKMQRGTMYPVRSKARADDNVPFRDLMAAIVDRQDLNAKYLQRLAEERKRGPLPGKGNGQTPQNRVNKQMVLDPSAKTPQVVTENHHSFPKIEQTTKQKKKEPNGISYSDHEKSPYDKMEAVRSYARRREQIVTHEKSEQAVRGQKPSELLDAASVDSGCSSDKSTDGDMKRVERILQSIHVGRTRAGGLPKDARAARRLHYVVAHGPSNAPQKKPKLDNMNRFYTPSLDSKSLSHPRTKSVPSSWEPHGELKVHPKYRTPSDGVCKYYCRNYPDYLREMQMEKLLKKQRVLHKTAERSPVQETDGVLGCDLSELVKPSSPNKYNQDYSFA
ncbi:uncharacterized protein LOC135491109 isoform X2 [Lineus longissimus]|uniref:uncharacterized protein LOC135491109 isoform X2 n=1 Tax=Lineus longissimus TaxID=88925 RepID=UPI002B4EBAF4